MISSFSNYYLKSFSPENIISFGKKIYKDLIKSDVNLVLKEKINLAIANLYYAFDTSEINPYLNRYNINFIKAYRIDTLNDDSIIVVNPKKIGNRILEDLELERSFRTTLILNELTDNFILLNYNKLIEQKNLSHINEIDIAEEIHKLILSNKCSNKNICHYKTPSAIYENVLKPIYTNIPLNKYSTEYILSKLKNETVILANPNTKNLDLLGDNRVSGIIQTPWLSQKIVEVAQSLRLEVYPGTGEII